MTGLPGLARLWRWLALAALIVALDQATKLLAVAMLVPYRPLAVVPLLNLTLMYNEGAAFSFLAGADGWQRWLFAGLAVVISVVIVIWMARLQPGETRVAVALALILGGAVGNLIDRLWQGRVTDFIDVYYQSWHWPAFNLADSAITVGAVVMVVDALLAERRRA